MNLNNQRWNHFICSNTGNLLIILIGMSLSYFWIKSQDILSDIFNDHEKLLLSYDLLQLFINLSIPFSGGSGYPIPGIPEPDRNFFAIPKPDRNQPS